MNQHPKTLSIRSVVLASGIMFLLGGALGSLVSDSFFASPDAPAAGFSSELLAETYNEIQERFAGDLATNEELEYGAVKGLTAALGDPHTSFFDPDEATIFEQTINGEFQGIGAEIGVNDDNQLVIIAPLPGYPAEQAGLKAGDRIVRIDGQETAGLTVDEAVDNIRGEAGTQIVLHILRDAEEEEREFSITRSQIKIASVSHRVESRDQKKIGVLNISRFGDDTADLVEDAVREFLLQDVDGVIVDLRNNPGGRLQAAIDVAGHFIGEEIVVVEKRKNQNPVNYRSKNTESLSGVPVAVLVDEGSASASEILAGAIQDRDRGTIIGTTTFGKGSVQDVIEFDDGSILKLTIAQWLTPNGRSIESEGIEPDIIVEYTESDAAADRDPQFDRAVSELLGT